MPPASLPMPVSDAASLAEAVEETLQLLAEASSPILVAGVEVHRRGLQEELLGLVERTPLKVASTLTGKSVLGERHPAISAFMRAPWAQLWPGTGWNRQTFY